MCQSNIHCFAHYFLYKFEIGAIWIYMCSWYSKSLFIVFFFYTKIGRYYSTYATYYYPTFVLYITIKDFFIYRVDWSGRSLNSLNMRSNGVWLNISRLLSFGWKSRQYNNLILGYNIDYKVPHKNINWLFLVTTFSFLDLRLFEYIMDPPIYESY